MNMPGSFAWLARHEARLAWRDMLSMMTAGRRDRERKVAIGIIVFVAFMHFIAYLVLGYAGRTLRNPDLQTLIAITASVALSGSAMLSQAMESVTRTFYTRSDLELILSSPARGARVFAVRIGAIALAISFMSLFFIGAVHRHFGVARRPAMADRLRRHCSAWPHGDGACGGAHRFSVPGPSVRSGRV